MPRYVFDIYDNDRLFRDDIGHEFADIEAVRAEAMNTLPQIAYDKIPSDGDRQSFVVIAKDEDGRAVYSATLSYVGLKLEN